MTAREVPLYGKKASGRVALVDEADYELVMQYRWRLWENVRLCGSTAGPYALTTAPAECAGGKRREIRMHKLITGWEQTDHRNHDGLDNQRHNLRDATGAQNNRNRRPEAGTASPYKGVCWHGQAGKWFAKIWVQDRSVCLGFYVDPEDAARAYDAAAREHFGEFAWFNFPGERAA